MLARTLAVFRFALFALATTGCLGILFPKPTPAIPPEGAAEGAAPTGTAPTAAAVQTTSTTPTATGPASPASVEAVLGYRFGDIVDLDKVATAFARADLPYLVQTRTPLKRKLRRRVDYRDTTRGCDSVGEAFDGRMICAGHFSWDGYDLPPTVAYLPEVYAERTQVDVPAHTVVLRWSHGHADKWWVVTADGTGFLASDAELEPHDPAHAVVAAEPVRHDIEVDEIAWMVSTKQLPDAIGARVERIRADHAACQKRFYDTAGDKEQRLLVEDILETTRRNRIDAAYDEAFEQTSKVCRKHSLGLKDVVLDAEAARRPVRQKMLDTIRERLTATPARG